MGTDSSKPRLSTTGDPKDYTAYGDRKVTTSNDVALETGERREVLNAGAKQPPKIGAVGGNAYPGRATPKAEEVKTAEAKPGTAKRCSERQLQEQRQNLK